MREDRLEKISICIRPDISGVCLFGITPTPENLLRMFSEMYILFG